MSDGVTIKVNIGDFREEIKQLGTRIERRIATNAVRAAARVFRDEARRIAPVLLTPKKGRVPGALKRSIAIFRSRRQQRGTVEYYVGVRAGKVLKKRGGDPFYWRFLEGGWIPRGPGQRIRGGERKRALERSRSLKAGARRYQYPFLEPAFRRAGTRALREFEAAFNTGMATEIK